MSFQRKGWPNWLFIIQINIILNIGHGQCLGVAASLRGCLQEVQHFRRSQILQGLRYHHPRIFPSTQDPTIARKAFKISGSILSNNAVAIPDPSGEVKACNLVGRYVFHPPFSFTSSSLQLLKNISAFTLKSESETVNQESDLPSRIWRKSMKSRAAMYNIIKVDPQNPLCERGKESLDDCLHRH